MKLKFFKDSNKKHEQKSNKDMMEYIEYTDKITDYSQYQ
jgi:hypothetical protein